MKIDWHTIKKKNREEKFNNWYEKMHKLLKWIWKSKIDQEPANNKVATRYPLIHYDVNCEIMPESYVNLILLKNVYDSRLIYTALFIYWNTLCTVMYMFMY